MSQRTNRISVPASLALLAAGALLLRVALALALPNIFWPDEIFQTLEPAHRLAFGYGLVPWEFRVGARSWLLPGALAAVMRLTAPIGDGSSGYLTAIAVLLGTCSLLPVVVAFGWARRRGCSTVHALTAAWACSVWFDLLYFATKALNEVVAAHVLLAGFYLARFDDQRRSRLYIGGALLGLSGALRPQLLPAIGIAVLLLSGRDWRQRLWPLGLGVALSLLAAGLLDAATWGSPFHSFWTTVRVNLVEGRADFYGTESAWYYLRQLGAIWSWAAVIILALALLEARHEPALALTAAAIFVTHTLIAHKEYRFIYPFIVLVITMAGIQSAQLVASLCERLRTRALRIVVIAGTWLLWSALSYSGALRLTSDRTGSDVVSDPTASHWTRHGDLIEAFNALSDRSDVCGVALLNTPWYASPGYTYLHRNIPLFLLTDDTTPPPQAESFNVIVARGSDRLGAYHATRCFDGITCILERSGGCAPAPHYDVNRVIEERGE